MKFAVITHVTHIHKNNQYYGYAPYIREMNIWLKYVDEVIIVAPIVNKELNPIHEPYLHSAIQFNRVNEFDITSAYNVVKTLFRLPKIIAVTYKAMKSVDHIHLRCPGNMGLIGAVVQILFPRKPKTAKYAGNWDPKSPQPFTYKLQRWILSNTFLTKNMQVLVYGEWENQTKNIKPFFTATYSAEDLDRLGKKVRFGDLEKGRLSDLEKGGVGDEVRFLFVGTLSKGKQPLYAIQIMEQLHNKGKKVTLDLYGEGVLRNELEQYVTQNKLSHFVNLKGNQAKETVLYAYQNSHFLILPSKSEGWPKVVAEAMFWGCVPLVTPVSCVPYMLANGRRGLLLAEKLNTDVEHILSLIENPLQIVNMSDEGMNWSRTFTTDVFEIEIKKLLKRE
ncbi:glycosyltransferase family 4 protein [Flavobacterium sp.]|uniref:glycosyltransferase family 4 protein n=1 Tax=Flavobacterium sp. TaxID=239 RepID=UPI002FDE8BC5